MPKPEITDYYPKKAASGSELRISGHDLANAKVYVGQQLAQILEGNDSHILVRVPAKLKVGRNHDIGISTAFGNLNLKHAIEIIEVHQPSLRWHTFSAPVNFFTMPSKTNQKYLVLMALPADQPLPDGMTKETLHADLERKLNGPGLCTNGLWKEAAYGKISFLFDVFDDVINLKDGWFDIKNDGGFIIRATGATYPVTWSGGETLELTRENGFSASVPFYSGSQTIEDVLQTIATGIYRADVSREPDPSKRGHTIDVGIFLGQLYLQSRDIGSETRIVVGGTALSKLGFDNPVIVPGSEGYHKGDEVIEEALEKYLAGKSEEECETILTQLAGVILVYCGNDIYYRANALQVLQFTVGNLSVDLSPVWSYWRNAWETYAHEIGHNLGWPDLYYEAPPGVCELCDVWDIMAKGDGNHPTAWAKVWKSCKQGSSEPGWNSPWIEPSNVKDMPAPPPYETAKCEVLLLPTSCKMPVNNPFDLPLVHALRIPFDDNHSYYVEAREKGSFIHDTLGSADYDYNIPANGVIVTDAINDISTVEVSRENVCLLTPKTEPLRKAGDEYVKPLQGLTKIKVRVIEVIGSQPSIYRIEASWGPGSFFDLQIRPWQPPPWESPDIWIDSDLDNGWDEYMHSDSVRNPDIPGNPIGNGDRVRVDHLCHVYARVWNHGDRIAKDVKVDFSIVVPAGTGPGIPIGQTVTIPEIAPNSYGLAKIDWTPKNANEGHVCIQANIQYQDGEVNENNNAAQENITDWWLEGGSPFAPIEFPFQIRNPLSRRSEIRLHVRGLRQGYHVDVDPVYFWLDDSEVKQGIARIRADDDVRFESKKDVAPLISLEWSVHLDCNWVTFGGISGWAHAVRKSMLDARLRPIIVRAPIPRLAIIDADAKTAVGAVKETNVTVRLIDSLNKTVLITHTKTNSEGRAEVRLSLPPNYSLAEEYTAEILLSPGLGTGPAEKYLKFRFTA